MTASADDHDKYENLKVAAGLAGFAAVIVSLFAVGHVASDAIGVKLWGQPSYAIVPMADSIKSFFQPASQATTKPANKTSSLEDGLRLPDGRIVLGAAYTARFG